MLRCEGDAGMSSTDRSILALIRMAQRGRVRPSLKPMRSHTGFIFVPIEDSKPSCVVCGDTIPKGRHYACSVGCQASETLRVKLLRKRIREARQPKRPFPKRIGDALGRLFG